MREITDKIQRLIHAYSGQLELYQQIKKTGSQEANYIAKGQLNLLLEALKHKEALLKEAGGYESEIRLLQEQLVAHFKLSDFSLPQLKKVASVYYQADLTKLEAVINELLPVLELLEAQEQKNEASLTHYIESNKQINKKVGQKQQAARAYGQQND